MGSLFDGSGGFPLGGLMSGVTPVWASEILFGSPPNGCPL